MLRPGNLFATLVTIGAVAVAAAGPAQAATTHLYVALGDSYTAGPLIPNPKGDPVDCGQSDHNYPTLVAEAIHPGEFRDVSCGSAETEHMTKPQDGLPLGGTNPPQFNALDDNVDLVTLGIGGNDMGFGGIVTQCSELAIDSNGQGHPCQDYYTANGTNEIARRLDQEVAPKLAAVIDGIHARSPGARLLVVGYPDPVPPYPGCYPVLPIAPDDLAFLHDVAARLSGTVQRVAEAGGAEFVPLLQGSIGHDICQLPGTKWYEGIVLTAPAYPAHPNALGMEFAARQVLSVLGRPVPNNFAIVREQGRRTGAIVLRLRAPARGWFRVAARPIGALRYRTRQLFAARAGELVLRLRPRSGAGPVLRRPGRMGVRLSLSFAPIAGQIATRTATVRVG